MRKDDTSRTAIAEPAKTTPFAETRCRSHDHSRRLDLSTLRSSRYGLHVGKVSQRVSGDWCERPSSPTIDLAWDRQEPPSGGVCRQEGLCYSQRRGRLHAVLESGLTTRATGPGNPRRPFATLTTDSVPVSDRVDFWQDLFVSCRVAKPASLPGSAFHGRIARYTRGDGASFARITGSPLVCDFGRSETGRMILGIVRSGTARVRHDDEHTTTLDTSSGLVLLNSDSGLTTSSTDYELAQLALPRELVVEALGRPGPRIGELTVLPRGGLAPLLGAHLETMAVHGEALDEVDAAAAMHATVSLATAFLSRAFRSVETRDETFDDVLFVAARRYIEAHASRHDLTARVIASVIGCSRAHLYRVFLERNHTIGDVLREVRLSRARMMLLTDPDRPIGTIAFESGYSGLSAFGKAFRRRFGASPREYRLEPGVRVDNPAERRALAISNRLHDDASTPRPIDCRESS